jgi:hypothetical protein
LLQWRITGLRPHYAVYCHGNDASSGLSGASAIR